jgi:hypothetical protein
MNEIPTRQEFADGLVGLGALQGVLLVAVGVVYLMCGWKAVKLLVVANAGVLGALVGAFLGSRLLGDSGQIIAAVAMGVLLSALAWPLMKQAVGAMGALVGGLLGYGLWAYVAALSGSAAPTTHAWAGALIGVLTLGLLAFVVFKEAIILFTSVQGAVLGISGLLALLMKFSALRDTLHMNLIENVHLLPVMIIVPTLIGITFQNTELAKKAKKKAKPAMA